MTAESDNAEPGRAGGATRPPAMPGSGRPDEVDVDRGAAFGAVVGITMFVLFQAMILGLFQSGVVSDDVSLWQPLRFAGITQGIYVVPSLLFFVNRKCPTMAAGFTVIAAIVLAGTTLALIL